MTKLPNADAPRNTDGAAGASLMDEVRALLHGLREEVQHIREEVQSIRTRPETDRLLTRDEAADRLRISTRTLDDLEASGRLQAVRIGRRVLYHPDTLDAYIRSQAGEGGRR
jgi:excisionase family DNA binding protein